MGREGYIKTVHCTTHNRNEHNSIAVSGTCSTGEDDTYLNDISKVVEHVQRTDDDGQQGSRVGEVELGETLLGQVSHLVRREKDVRHQIAGDGAHERHQRVDRLHGC